MKTVTIKLTLPDHVLQRLIELARENGLSIDEQVDKLVTESPWFRREDHANNLSD